MMMSEKGKKHMRLLLKEGRAQLELQRREKKLLLAKQKCWKLEKDVIAQRKLKESLQKKIKVMEKVM